MPSGVSPIARQQSITRWNLLALLTILGGGAAVLLLDQLWIARWSATGKAFPIARRMGVELPAGRSLVYYESPHSVPRESATLYLWGSDGERIRLTPPVDDISYRVFVNGWSGRALWELNLDRADTYEFKCDNHNYLSDSEIPADDRVVFLKSPDALTELKTPRTVLQVAGASCVLVAAGVCYARHGRTLRRARAQSSLLR